MALTIKNCTPHNVAVFTGTLFDPSSGYNVGGNEVLNFPPCGTIATARNAITPLTAMPIQGVEVPMCKRNYAEVTKLPSESDFYIVSSAYAQAMTELGQDTSKLLVPCGHVKKNGKIVGCTGFVKYIEGESA